MSDVTTSRDPRDWREAFETTEHGPELDRIRARVAAARQRGENDALVAVVLDEASQAACVWRKRALEAEEARDEFEAAYVTFHEKALEAEERAEELARVNVTLTEREVAATREAKRLRLLVDGADDVELARRIEWATGKNGRTILDNIRAEGLDVIAVRPEQANA